MIELPPTIRPCRRDELPNNDLKLLEHWNKLKTAPVAEGYLISDKPVNDDLPYSFFAAINVDNSRLWQVILALTDTLPEMAAPLFGLGEDVLLYGDYTEKIQMLAGLSPHKKMLIQEPFIEWGIIYQTEEFVTEIFVPSAKYIRFWGMDKNQFKDIMHAHDLFEKPNIEFIDQYPRVKQPLFVFDNDAPEAKEFIQILEQRFITPDSEE